MRTMYLTEEYKDLQEYMSKEFEDDEWEEE